MRELRERQGLPGIALSGFGMDDDREASSAAGFSEHFTKPVDWARLRESIERLTTGDQKTKKKT
jgi:CheY-like chemotaxis protein